MAATSPKDTIQSAARTFQVLEFLSANGPAGLMEVGTALNFSKSTTHRMLSSLIQIGYVEQNADTSKYDLTYKVVRLSNNFLSRVDVVSLAHPYLKELADRCHETVHLVLHTGNGVVYIDKIEPASMKENSSIRMSSQIGLMRAMHDSGVGKAILADLSLEEVREIWDNTDIIKKTEFTITSFDELLIELARIRECGYAIDNEEHEKGVRCIAASIPDHNKVSRYAVSVSAPAIRMTDAYIRDYCGELLRTRELLVARFQGL